MPGAKYTCTGKQQHLKHRIVYFNSFLRLPIELHVFEAQVRSSYLQQLGAHHGDEVGSGKVAVAEHVLRVSVHFGFTHLLNVDVAVGVNEWVRERESSKSKREFSI